jgi:hypothetical protein
LAAAIPANIRFGTSTWTYDGWTGDVYHRRYRGPQPAKRLEEYARYPLFRTVGIDSAFYDPPSEEELVAYARALPPGFPCVSKVWERVTLAIRPGRAATACRNGQSDFLTPDLQGCARPYVACSRSRGLFVSNSRPWGGISDPQGRSARCFLSSCRGLRYAVEPEPELLTGLHGEVLKRHGIAHVFNSWTEMPPIGEQLDSSWTFPAEFTVARALLKPGRRYADAVKQFQPYDRVQEPLPDLRRDLVRLVSEAHRRRVEAYILANNRAEGNGPGTIRAVARQWLDGDAQGTS